MKHLIERLKYLKNAGDCVSIEATKLAKKPPYNRYLLELDRLFETLALRLASRLRVDPSFESIEVNNNTIKVRYGTHVLKFVEFPLYDLEKIREIILQYAKEAKKIGEKYVDPIKEEISKVIKEVSKKELFSNFEIVLKDVWLDPCKFSISDDKKVVGVDFYFWNIKIFFTYEVKSQELENILKELSSITGASFSNNSKDVEEEENIPCPCCFTHLPPHQVRLMFRVKEFMFLLEQLHDEIYRRVRKRIESLFS